MVSAHFSTLSTDMQDLLAALSWPVTTMKWRLELTSKGGGNCFIRCRVPGRFFDTLVSHNTAMTNFCSLCGLIGATIVGSDMSLFRNRRECIRPSSSRTVMASWTCLFQETDTWQRMTDRTPSSVVGSNGVHDWIVTDKHDTPVSRFTTKIATTPFVVIMYEAWIEPRT